MIRDNDEGNDDGEDGDNDKDDNNSIDDYSNAKKLTLMIKVIKKNTRNNDDGRVVVIGIIKKIYIIYMNN